MKSFALLTIALSGCFVVEQNKMYVPPPNDMARSGVNVSGDLAQDDMLQDQDMASVSVDMTNVSAAQDLSTSSNDLSQQIDLATPVYNHYSTLLLHAVGNGNWSDDKPTLNGSDGDQALAMCHYIHDKFISFAYTGVSDCTAALYNCGNGITGVGWRTGGMNNTQPQIVYIFYDVSANVEGIGCYKIGNPDFAQTRWDQ